MRLRCRGGVSFIPWQFTCINMYWGGAEQRWQQCGNIINRFCIVLLAKSLLQKPLIMSSRLITSLSSVGWGGLGELLCSLCDVCWAPQKKLTGISSCSYWHVRASAHQTDQPACLTLVLPDRKPWKLITSECTNALNHFNPYWTECLFQGDFFNWASCCALSVCRQCFAKHCWPANRDKPFTAGERYLSAWEWSLTCVSFKPKKPFFFLKRGTMYVWLFCAPRNTFSVYFALGITSEARSGL